MSANMNIGAGFLLGEVSPEDVFTPEDFSTEQKQMGETADQFVHNEVGPHVEKIDEHDNELLASLLRKSGELGLMCIDGPEEFGGLDLDKATTAYVVEKIGQSGSFSVGFSAHTGIGTLPFVYYGNQAQKEKYLEKLLNGEWLGGYCLTEAGSGSDALACDSTAVLSEDGSHYLINGTKQFITNGGFANVFVVFAKIDKEHFTCFIVEADYQGVTIGAEEQKMGITGSSTTQVIFDNAKVPVENVLGEIGKGHKVALNVLNVGRFKLGAATTGGAKAALIEGVKYSNIRSQFQTKISAFGAIQEKIANTTADIYAAETLIYRVAGLLDKQLEDLDKSADNYYEEYQKQIEEFVIECGISKVYCSDVLAHVVDEVVQIFGGYGIIKEYPAERFYRDERINRIFEGTNEINRLLIPGTLLKRAMKGTIPLMEKGQEALEALMNPSFDDIDEDELFAKEKVTITNLKTLFMIVAGAALQKHQATISNEQEILLALADVSIQIFAIEGAVLRAIKNWEKGSDSKKELYQAAVTATMFNGVEKITTAAKKVAFYVEEGDNLTMILGGIRRFTKYDATGLLKAKRTLAKSFIENERYPF